MGSAIGGFYTMAGGEGNLALRPSPLRGGVGGGGVRWAPADVAPGGFHCADRARTPTPDPSPKGGGELGSVQRRHRRAFELHQLAGAAVVDLLRPERVLQQGAADGDEVEVAALQAPEQLVERG